MIVEKGAIMSVKRRDNKNRILRMIDGKCGFLYLDKNGKPAVAHHWQWYFRTQGLVMLKMKC